MRILCLDVGEKRIGVAQADSDTRIAVPAGFILVDGTEWDRIRKFTERYDTTLFVVGLPRSNSGNETAQSQYVRNFVEALKSKIPGAKVVLQDESLTSVVAEERLKARKRHYEKGEIDAEAATIILQDFLESHPRTAQGRAVNPRLQRVPEKSAEQSSENREENNGKKKSKKGLIAVSLIIFLALAGAGGFGLYRYIKQKRDEERQEWYRQQEAEMVASTFDFTIRPGETIMDVKKNLLAVDRNGKSTSEERIPNYTQEEVDKAFDASYDFDFLKTRPEGASLEGYLYPETIQFYGTSTVEEVLERFLAEMGKMIDENGLEAKYAERGLTLHQGIILASVVQKEANPADQAIVAQVFLSRMSYGIPLGSDVTVSYALDLIDPDRTTYNNNQDALKVDSCYNTRVYAGLPCGAISNPGPSALNAVASPTDTDYLYFLTGDDGLMYYGHTEAEHNQNIINHCQELCNVLL